MEVYMLIKIPEGEVLGIYDSKEKARNDIKKIPKFTLINISKPVKLNTLMKDLYKTKYDEQEE